MDERQVVEALRDVAQREPLRLARRCELELLYRVAKADSLGRNAPWVPREKWFGSDAQEWFIARARALGVEHQPPMPQVPDPDDIEPPAPIAVTVV